MSTSHRDFVFRCLTLPLLAAVTTGVVSAQGPVTDPGVFRPSETSPSETSPSETSRDLTPPAAGSQRCEWAAGYHVAGPNDTLWASTTFEMAGEPVLVAAGSLTTLDDQVTGPIVAWDGEAWSSLGQGLQLGGGRVTSLLAFDDGGGPRLFAAGTFLEPDGSLQRDLKVWDGSSWSSLVPDFQGIVDDLEIYDDGSGSALYVGGQIVLDSEVASVAKWDGSELSALGLIPLEGVGATLEVYDDGNGPALYVGGSTFELGGVEGGNVAKWDGTTWSFLPDELENSISTLRTFEGAEGPVLVAAGSFDLEGPTVSSGIAAWDGAAWSGLGEGPGWGGHTLEVHDDGSGPALYVGGSLPPATERQGVLRWDGVAWEELDDVLLDDVETLTSYDLGEGPRLFAGGSFESSDEGVVNRAAAWDGLTWTPLTVTGWGRGVNRAFFRGSMTVHDPGDGPALYLGGDFQVAGGVEASSVVRWDGSTWNPFGRGLRGASRALQFWDEGAGPLLFAAGAFRGSPPGGGANLLGITKWTGFSWSEVGNGLDGTVEALAIFDDGSGPALYAAGSFEETGSLLPANHIVRWNDTSIPFWTELGSGIGGASPRVVALEVFDDGTGAALYAAGEFTTAGGIPTANIARWDGASWAPLGSGVDARVNDLEVFDDGGGPALYAAGEFTAAGGLAANRIARWDGIEWSALGPGTDDDVRALRVHDDGNGPALMVAGDFATAGGVEAERIAKWDGASWSALEGGFDGEIHDLEIYDDGSGPSLHVFGRFSTAGGRVATNFAKYDCTLLPLFDDSFESGDVDAWSSHQP